MLTSRYLTSVKNLSAILSQIRTGTAPTRYTGSHLKDVGFKSSNDAAVIPLLKDLGFLTQEGAPTSTYHEYRDASRSRRVLGASIKHAYQDLFLINERPSATDRPSLEGKFKSTHNASDNVAQRQAATFLALLELADIDEEGPSASEDHGEAVESPARDPHPRLRAPSMLGLRYNIEVHLPPTKDVEVYNAIFKALKEHLIDD